MSCCGSPQMVGVSTSFPPGALETVLLLSDEILTPQSVPLQQLGSCAGEELIAVKGSVDM